MRKLIQKAVINNKGFTLIELLVVISIIAILIGISLFGTQGIFENSRDVRRKSDLKQYQSALENYANRNNSLFYSTDTLDPSGNSALCTAVNAQACPDDPVAGESYSYQSDGSWAAPRNDAVRYALWAKLERPSSPVTYYYVCSNGKSGNSTLAAPTAPGACPF